MTNPLAVFTRPKFQFNGNVAMGLAGTFGIVRQGRADHCINRPRRYTLRERIMFGHADGSFAPQKECAIGKKG